MEEILVELVSRNFDLISVYGKYMQVMSEIIGEDPCGTFIYISKMWTAQRLMPNTFIQLSSLFHNGSLLAA